MRHYKMAWSYIGTALFTMWWLPPDLQYFAWFPIGLAAANAAFIPTT